MKRRRGLGDPAWMTSHDRTGRIGPVVTACAVPLQKKVGLVPNTKPYGCGAWGCVYPGKPGQVVKVLTPSSVEEVQATLFVARLGARRPSELPRIYKVYQLGRCSAGAGGFVVVREDVGPIPDDLNLHAKATVKSDDVLQTLSSIELGKLSAFGDCAYLADYLGQVVEFGVSKVPEAEGLFRAAAALQVWGCEHGVEVTDTHPDNWGQRRDGSYVLRDFGATYGDPAARQDPSHTVTLNGLRRW